MAPHLSVWLCCLRDFGHGTILVSPAGLFFGTTINESYGDSCARYWGPELVWSYANNVKDHSSSCFRSVVEGSKCLKNARRNNEQRSRARSKCHGMTFTDCRLKWTPGAFEPTILFRSLSHPYWISPVLPLSHTDGTRDGYQPCLKTLINAQQ